jgi:hypothetical protein
MDGVIRQPRGSVVMITIELTEDEALSLRNLLDVAVRAGAADRRACGRPRRLFVALLLVDVCCSHKTCQQDRYENKVESNLQCDHIGSSAKIVDRMSDGPKNLK